MKNITSHSSVFMARFAHVNAFGNLANTQNAIKASVVIREVKTHRI